MAKDVPVIPLYRSRIRRVPLDDQERRFGAGHELWNAENWWLGE